MITGSVVASVMTELTMLCRELDQRRQLADDLAAFMKANPSFDEQFGDFQRARRAA